MWRSMSLAPALHIFRIGSLKRTKMLSENQEIDFEHLIQCGRNQTNPFDGSSKFSGSHNEIRRAPTSTHRPLTSTRDPYVRRLTFYDASRTLLEEKEHKKENKDPTNKQFTITRIFKKMSTRPMSSTTTIRPTTRSSSNLNSKAVKFDSKRASREPTTNKWGTNVRTTTIQPTEWAATQVAR
uniref:Uncharacterized protein n=1 Tax=Caenorhabditis japonica TaxID=281687 RepID=A0A8R1HRD2_CAEJA